MKKIDWRLNSLRGSTEHLTQQLNITLANCIAARKRSVENRSEMAAMPVRFAKRESEAPPVAEVPKAVAVPIRSFCGSEESSKVGHLHVSCVAGQAQRPTTRGGTEEGRHNCLV